MKKKRTIANNWFIIQFVARYTPGYLISAIILGVIWGVIHFTVNVYFIKELFDQIEKNARYSSILSLVGLMALFYIIVWFYHQWFWHSFEGRARLKLYKRMQTELFSKAINLDLAFYDNPEFYTDFVWAMQEADLRAVGVIRDLSKFITRVLSSLAIVGLLLTVDPVIVVIILLSIGATVVINFINAKIVFQRDMEMKPVERRNDYIGRVFYLNEYAKEIRVNNVKKILFADFDQNVQKAKAILNKYGKKTCIISFLLGIITTTMFDVGIILLLLYKLMLVGSITLGSFAAAINSTRTLYWQLNEIMEYVVKFEKHSFYIERMRVFLNYQSTVINNDKAMPVSEESGVLTINNVTFGYDMKKPVLKKINLQIRPKEKVAIVGYNGAGKSTLIKLISRLYDPTEGEILLNGVNIKDYDIQEYRERIGIVFQDYKIFASSIGTNVLLDDRRDDELVCQSLDKIGFTGRLNKLEAGIETPLTREFASNGVELSGGENQKIAIARVFAKKCNMIILDEPSSALDPKTEYELNQIIADKFADKTVIFISHRLSTTRMADKIYMIEDGQIIEEGNHDQLMQFNGKYAEMFNMQSEKYRIA